MTTINIYNLFFNLYLYSIDSIDSYDDEWKDIESHARDSSSFCDCMMVSTTFHVQGIKRSIGATTGLKLCFRESKNVGEWE